MNRRLIFGKSRRLHKRRDFERVFSARCSVADRYLVLYVAPNGLEYLRLGIPVGRKFGGAIRRNRAKRLIREAFRLEQWELTPGFDLICIPQVGQLADLGRYRESIRRLAASGVRRWRKRDAESGGEAAQQPAGSGLA